MEKHAARRPSAMDHLSLRDFAIAFDAWATEARSLNYSRRSFARWCGVKSPNFMSLVLSGQRRLQGEWLEAFIRGSKVSEDEANYLRLLSLLEDQDDPSLQNDVLLKIEKMLEKSGATSQSLKLLQLSKDTLAWDLLQLFDLEGCDGEAMWMKGRLRRPTTIPQIRACLDNLLSLGLLQKDGDGKLRSVHRHLATPDQVKSAENMRFHLLLLSEAQNVLRDHDPQDRSYGSLTIGVAASQWEALKGEITAFGKSLIRKYSVAPGKAEEVVRLNLQLYPLTQPPKDKGSSK